MTEAATLIRLMLFLGLAALLIAAEAAWPRRRPAPPRGERWCANVGLVVIDSLLLRLLTGAGAVGVAYWVEARDLGLLHALAWPRWVEFVVALLALDLLIYGQHRMMHVLPPLWRLHRVHHSDPGFDVTTALRFHPFEILLSMALKMAAVAALGAPPWAVVVFEVLLNASSMFNHANLNLPTKVDRALRRFVVTPDMHRVHHSIHRDETDSNFGFSLPWWDHLFGSYRAQPRDGHEAMPIGLAEIPQPGGLLDLLVQPVRRDAASVRLH
ncbi:sterol desaturase family protein [Sinimarinibacterium thermocellulolyticum]|uniref:Sterol desaturase family protein n=1 Tax=Sinimarinibacterium thermocellulolyticum TaxID=3170016 RepID=A0ABV2ADT7_9GAMM